MPGAPPPSWLTVNDTVITRNTANVAGGGLFAQSVFPGSSSSDSSSSSDGDIPVRAYRLLVVGAGTSLVRNTAVRGGGAYVDLQDSTAVLEGACAFEGNEANTGGGAYIAIGPDGRGVNSRGGRGVESGAGRTRLVVGQSRWEGNSALQDGGGLYLQLPEPPTEAAAGCAGTAGGTLATAASLYGLSVINNTARNAGGAVHIAAGRRAASGAKQPQAPPTVGTNAYGGCSGLPGLWVEGSVLEGNSAGSAGGGLWVGPGAAISLSNTSVRGNTAAEGFGGGVAAEGCAWLGLLGGCEVAGNAAPQATGGGVYAGGCGRVLLQGVAVRGNRALAGGGVHLDGGGEGTGSVGMLAMLEGSVFADNTAELALGSISTVANNTRASSGGGDSMWVGGRGGALYVTGRVAAVLTDTDLSEGNRGVFGWGIATTQTCAAAQPPPPSAPPSTPSPPSPAPRWRPTLRPLRLRPLRHRLRLRLRHHRRRCHPRTPGFPPAIPNAPVSGQ